MAAGREAASLSAADRAVRRMIWALLAADLVLIAVFLVLFPPGYSVQVLVIGLERSDPNWCSAANLLILAQLLAFAAWRAPMNTWRETLLLLAPALLFVLMSVEEVAAVREHLDRVLVPEDGGDGPMFALPGTLLTSFLLVVGLAAIAKAYARIVRPPNAIVAKAIVRVAAFLLGAVGVELVFDEPGRQALRIGPAAVEEDAELIGVTLLIWAASDVAMPYLRAVLRGSALRSA